MNFVAQRTVQKGSAKHDDSWKKVKEEEEEEEKRERSQDDDGKGSRAARSR